MSNRKAEFQAILNRLDQLVQSTDLLEDRLCRDILQSRVRGWMAEVEERNERQARQTQRALFETWENRSGT